MISLPFRRSQPSSSIADLYGMIVARARAPAFYLGYGVPDTVSGRLDMIVLHLVLVLRRLAALGATVRIGQPLFDMFCQDIDDNFREMGVGDLAVPKEMRRVAEAFYGRAKVYEHALEANDSEALAAAVARNVFGLSEPSLGARRLAAYMREAAVRLDQNDADALARGDFEFPEPGTSAQTRLDP